jgi:hypothetical protein
MITEFGILSVILNIVLLVIVVWLLFLLYKSKKQLKRVTKEISDDGLEHHIQEIKKRGFDLTLKPKGKK